MRKAISTKKVLNALLNEYNSRTLVCDYARAAKEYAVADEVQDGLDAIQDILRTLGFLYGHDYEMRKVERKVNDVTFTARLYEVIE